MKLVSIALVILILLSPIMTTPARAESSDGGASNGTLVIVGVVIVVFLIAAWRMDFGNDDPITNWQPATDGVQLVLCQPPAAGAPGTVDASAGLGLRGAF